LLTSNDEDLREDTDFIDGLIPDHLADEDPLSDEECAKADLPPNPEHRRLESGDFLNKPDFYIRLLERVEYEDIRKRYAQQLIEAETFVAQKKEWDAEFEAFIDLHKTRLFLELREGRIHALGQELPQPSFIGSLVELEESGWEGWHNIEWQTIPPDFWISTKINWAESWAEGKTTAYCLILMDFKELFNHFPPRTEISDGVVKIGNAFAQDTNKTTVPTRTMQRGRPSYDWDAFHLEVAKRLLQGNVPAKKEAFVADMQDWCKDNWHREIGRSTVSQKLKPYYDQFIRNSKNGIN
jgi:hypothetical protein